MSTYDNGRPPVPGSGDRETQQIPPQPTVQQTASREASQPTTQRMPQHGADGAYGQGEPGFAAPPTAGDAGKNGKKPNHTVRNVLFGVLGGAVGGLLIVLAVNAFGLMGSKTAITTKDGATGQTINITADTENLTVAKAAAAKALPSVVVVNVTTQAGSGLGSGVVYGTDGNIITNYHVIEGATSVSVTIDGKSFDATVVGSDPSSDLAVLHVNLGDTKVTPMEIGDSDKLVAGDWVMSVGSPFGLDQSVSAGIVSSLARNQMMQSTAGYTLYTNLIQTDAAINPGNSGGALVDAEGKLVGICTLFSSDTESFAGIGFAIPGNYAVDVANKIIAGETVTHAYIGVSMQTVNAQNAMANNLSVNQGAYVAEVTQDSPAAAAGIQKGDIITAVNGKAITSADGMILDVRSHQVGETISVTLMRGKEEKTVDVTLGSDEKLQEQLKQQSQRQNTLGDTPNSYGYGGNGGNGGGSQDVLNQIYERLYNNRGGSYDTSDSVAGEAA
ncbi:MAG: trypsin-like peptidase domain-containing protein [Olsenella sp.]|nr:trypsin-like peptidase domain-containing protein [Olsenella sp.]